MTAKKFKEPYAFKHKKQSIFNWLKYFLKIIEESIQFHFTKKLEFK